jgi:hypothetical protein
VVRLGESLRGCALEEVKTSKADVTYKASDLLARSKVREVLVLQLGAAESVCEGEARVRRVREGRKGKSILIGCMTRDDWTLMADL